MLVLVRVDVVNTGTRASDEVVQLYIHEVERSVKQPSKELRGFEKVALRPGQQKTVAFRLPVEQLSFWDAKTHGLVVEPGAFDVLVGSPSEDIRVQTRFGSI
ncbi:MAG: fibronectin type III-like domain-contianing protein [Verrucomicrobiota bacterium]